MVKAVLHGGVIQPIDPLPPEWKEGQELWVEGTVDPDDRPEAIDQWYQELEALCAGGNPVDEERLHTAIREMRQEAKEMMRREMGL